MVTEYMPSKPSNNFTPYIVQDDMVIMLHCIYIYICIYKGEGIRSILKKRRFHLDLLEDINLIKYYNINIITLSIFLFIYLIQTQLLLLLL